MEPLDSPARTPDLRKRIVFIGVGGASCSGKTTLAKHLRSVLPGSFIIHQDDFAPPEELLPYHATLNVRDWDDPVGAIEWPRMVKSIREVRQNAALREDWKSQDELNPQTAVPLQDELLQSWAATFKEEQQRAAKERKEEIIWAIVDGFLLYWHPDIVRELDIRIFLRVPLKTLRHRRDNRPHYYTIDGSFWKDPPGYGDDIVWPAYFKAHHKMFQNNDVEFGKPLVPSPLVTHSAFMDESPGGKLVVSDVGTMQRDEGIASGKDEQMCGVPVDGLEVLDAEAMNMEQIFIATCKHILDGRSVKC